MRIRYKTDWYNRYFENPDKSIKIYQCKLYDDYIDSIDSADIESIESLSSPTIGYYEFSGIISDGLLQISIRPGDSDYSVERYKEILIYSEDQETLEVELAFIIDIEEGENLRRTVNLINIKNFLPKSKVSFSQSLDTERLEGPGQGRYVNIFQTDSLDTSAYIERESWLAYRQLVYSTDAEISGYSALDHLDTVRVNEFGLKIY